MKPEKNANASSENPENIAAKKTRNRKTDPLNIGFKTPLKEHKNPIIRGFARMGYTVWIVVMVVGLSLAFVAAIFLV